MRHLGDKLVLAKSSATGAPQFSQDLLHNTVKAGVDAGLETSVGIEYTLNNVSLKFLRTLFNIDLHHPNVAAGGNYEI